MAHETPWRAERVDAVGRLESDITELWSSSAPVSIMARIDELAEILADIVTQTIWKHVSFDLTMGDSAPEHGNIAV